MDLRELSARTAARHPWETARARFFCRVARAQAASGRALRVLDVGAGDGFFARALLRKLPTGSCVTCFDAHYTDEHLARFGADATPGLAFCRTLPKERFDLVLLLDVLEHIDDDRAFARALVADALAPDGLVLVSVPAHPVLYSRHDVVLGHQRRYVRATLEATLRSAGLAVVMGGGLFHSLLVPRALTKLAELARGQRASPHGAAPPDHAATEVGDFHAGPALSMALGAALALDNGVSWLAAHARLALPGLSVWALCKRAAP